MTPRRWCLSRAATRPPSRRRMTLPSPSLPPRVAPARPSPWTRARTPSASPLHQSTLWRRTTASSSRSPPPSTSPRPSTSLPPRARSRSRSALPPRCRRSPSPPRRPPPPSSPARARPRTAPPSTKSPTGFPSGAPRSWPQRPPAAGCSSCPRVPRSSRAVPRAAARRPSSSRRSGGPPSRGWSRPPCLASSCRHRPTARRWGPSRPSRTVPSSWDPLREACSTRSRLRSRATPL
mmetsp:Transcript_33/g.94  ORF Transcript_33/g.94 Transcript_33/m.94 type:complete len:235 (+) Transcript_33:1636-2340(+)